MDAGMAVGGGAASPWRGNEEVDEQREKPTVPLSPKPSPPSSHRPHLSDPTNLVRYSATTVTGGGGGGSASPWRSKEGAGEKSTLPVAPSPPSSYSSTANTSAIAVKGASPVGGFAAVKPEQAETRFSAVSAPVVSRLEAGGGGGGGRASGRPGEGTTRGVSPLTARWRQERLLGRAELGLRVCAFLFSLISFSVMASDKTQGWSGDSYYRYGEYRYVVGVNVIVFVYSGVQIMAYVYRFSAGNLALRRFTICLGFAADQILAYLLMSASSSAASLTEDTQALWGKDPFTNKAGGSVAISFFAFTALALSALTSGYHMYNCL
ncbi:CASP-like protein 4A3 [Nymphaea colorata]|uniref:CASP-like protein 4A3 n=1 Tax=Nymphaea colorata TaxID=210225 RepID=UPI00129DA915|nr:CASP-like protein 4A3 [Nymphaea colorata]